VEREGALPRALVVGWGSNHSARRIFASTSVGTYEATLREVRREAQREIVAARGRGRLVLRLHEIGVAEDRPPSERMERMVEQALAVRLGTVAERGCVPSNRNGPRSAPARRACAGR
jgi:hypothetical protein